MNTSICSIKKIDADEEKTKYSTERNIFHSCTSHLIVPIENKQIVVPLGIKNEICNKNIRNALRPINENTNNIPSLKYTKYSLPPKIFSPRKQNTNITKEKNRPKQIVDVPNLENKYKVCLNPTSTSTTMEIFTNKTNPMNHYYKDVRNKNDTSSYSSFGTHLDHGIRNQLFLESNLYSKYTEVDTNSTCSTRGQTENLDYSMSFIAKDKILGNNYQELNIPEKIYQENNNNFHKKQMNNSTVEIQKYRDDFNKFYSNIRPVINYNTINIIQQNHYSNNARTMYENGNNEVLKSYESPMNTKEPVLTAKVESLPDFTNKPNTNLQNLKSSIIPKENQDMLKTTYSISQKKINETDILLKNQMTLSEMIEHSTKQQIDNFNNESPMNGSIRKGKKKTMGACFFNLPCFSCQFLMTCDKT